MTKTEMIKNYFINHPDANPMEVASMFEISNSVPYRIRKELYPNKSVACQPSKTDQIRQHFLENPDDPPKEVAALFNISTSFVYYIRNKLYPEKASPRSKMISESRTSKIRKYFEDHPDANPKEVATLFNHSDANVYKIRKQLRQSAMNKVMIPVAPSVKTNVVVPSVKTNVVVPKNHLQVRIPDNVDSEIPAIEIKIQNSDGLLVGTLVITEDGLQFYRPLVKKRHDNLVPWSCIEMINTAGAIPLSYFQQK